MTAPTLSTITLLTEIVVSYCVYYVIWQGFSKGIFVRWLAFSVLIYESLFNISYMTSRLFGHVEPAAPTGLSTTVTLLAIFHGIFSLIMFLALVVFFLFASSRYRRGENFFLTYRSLTVTFGVAWAVSVISGIFFYFVLYF